MQLLRQNSWFFATYSVFLVIGAIMLFFQSDKGAFLLWLNQHNTPFFDSLFKFTNKMGEGAFYFIVLLCLLAVRISYSIYGLLCLAITGIIIQFLKLQVFSHIERPVVWFQNKAQLHFVDGVTMMHQHSFPSGHTATAFTLFCFLSLIIKNKRWGVVFLLMGIFAALARVYLAQHFLIDVYFGSLIGSAVAMIIYWVVKEHHWFGEHPIFASPLLKYFTQRRKSFEEK